MKYKHSILSQLSHEQLLNIAQSILICESNLSSAELIEKIINHQQTFGNSKIVHAEELKAGDFILMKISAPSFSKELKIGWSKVLRCYEVNTEEKDVLIFFSKYLDIFISNQSHMDLINNIPNKLIYIEAISTVAVGNASINCQNVVRAKVLPKLKFVLQVHDVNF